jgi:hypothetical protein
VTSYVGFVPVFVWWVARPFWAKNASFVEVELQKASSTGLILSPAGSPRAI